MLDMLRFPHHRASAEAEAECARTQQHGIVDAVWSEDGDALMFGCSLLIRDHRLDGKDRKKSDSHVRVYRADRVKEQYGLDKQGLVLFAMLSGGDYDTKGVPGCGPQLALKAAAQFGLGAELCMATQWTLFSFRAKLQDFFFEQHRAGTQIPPDFPHLRILNHYRTPCVSTSVQLQDLRGLRKGWDVPVDQAALRHFMRDMFNFWTKAWMRHVAPFLLAKTMARSSISADLDASAVEWLSIPTFAEAHESRERINRYRSQDQLRPSLYD